MRPTALHFTDAVAFGGAERILLTLLEGLEAEGWRGVIVHHAEPGLRRMVEEARALGIETWTVPRMQGRRGLLAAARFARQLRERRPAVFHAQLSHPLACRSGLIAAAFARVPVIATLHLYMPVGSYRSILTQRLVSLAVDRYIAVSQEVARRLRFLCLAPSRKIRVVRNGIRIGQLEGRSGGGPYASGSRPTVLTIARLHPQKGLEYLLRAAALVPEARFLVAGDGQEREALEAEARKSGLAGRLEFLGHRTDVPMLLRSADVFVLPSLYEGFPVSVLEALAAGTPVIATAVSGTDEIVVHGENGILVPPRDPHALGSAIREVLSDRSLARRLVAGGTARVRQFSAEAMTRGVCDVYAEVLGVAKGKFYI
jgi:glycosyltransferase involved in cell wall biosynthesis